MDYEKAYKDALSRAKDCHVNKKFSELDDNAQQLCEYIFPELKESDEMIRKELINFIKKEASSATLNANRLKFKSMLALLEKQSDYNQLVEEMKERKELLSKEKEKATSTNDKLSLGGRIAILEELLAFTKEKQDEQKPIDSYCKENCKGFQETGKCYADGECKAKRDAEHNPAWSEEDERNFYWISTTIQERPLTPKYTQQVHKILSWLKSLRPQPHWKPTDEQLMALRDAIDNNEMESLYNDLKKL